MSSFAGGIKKRYLLLLLLLLLQTLNTRYTELIIWHYLFSERDRETEISMLSGADRKPWWHSLPCGRSSPLVGSSGVH